MEWLERNIMYCHHSRWLRCLLEEDEVLEIGKQWVEIKIIDLHRSIWNIFLYKILKNAGRFKYGNISKLGY